MNLRELRNKANNVNNMETVVQPTEVFPGAGYVEPKEPVYRQPEPVYRQQEPVYRQQAEPVYRQQPQQSRENTGITQQSMVDQRIQTSQSGHGYGYSPESHVLDMSRGSYAPVEQQQEIYRETTQVQPSNQLVVYGADDYLLSVLNRSTPDGISILGFESAPDIVPVTISNIKDKRNRLNDKLLKIMVGTGCTVLPLRECGILNGVSKLQDFSIVTYNGKEYASFTGTNYDTKFRESIVALIFDKLSNAELFGLIEDEETLKLSLNPHEAVITRDFSFNGSPAIKVPGLCASELGHITKYFQKYYPVCITVDGNFPILTVGSQLATEKVTVLNV